MICLNSTCENHQKDLGLTKFCPECGQKTASPEPQSLTCPAPGCSNQGKDLGRMKFCSECGTTTVADVSAAQKSTALGFAPRASTEGVQLPPVQLPSGYAAYQGGGAGSSGSGRSIIAGDQNITHSTVVHNQDQTKQVRQCAVSGRQAEVTRGHVCPACGLWVHEDYYDRTLMRCDHCSTAQSKRSSEQFKGKVQQFLTDGVITKEELSELRSMGGNLGLSLPEQDTIISQLKQEMLSNNSAQRPMTLIDQSRWKAVLRAVENKVFSTDPVAGRVHLDSLRALHKSYPDDETIACLLVSILSGEMFDDPIKTLPEIERVLNAPCFAYDTPRKYLTRAVFYRGGTLLGQAKAQRSDGQGNWADMLEQFGEALREAASALESMFPNSEECHALQVAMMIDSYLLSGDETIREDVDLLLEGAASAAGDSDVGLAIKAAHANAIEGFGWGDDREMTIGKGLAGEYFGDLFTLNLLTLLKMMEGTDEEYGDEEITSIEKTEKLANQGDPEAQFQLGKIFQDADGVEENLAEAEKWYRLAAEQGHAVAQCNLGEIYYKGRGIEPDYEEALRWLHLAAEQGNPAAQYHLGYIYDNLYSWDGEEDDEVVAAQWYRLAADQGYADAQFSLGEMYNEGDGVDQDDEKALEWFHLAAENDNLEAQKYLGEIYRWGDGVEENLVEAVKWYRLAAEQGDEDAKRSLADLERNTSYDRAKSNLTDSAKTGFVRQNATPPPLLASSRNNELATIDVASIVYSNAEVLQHEKIFVSPSIPEKKLLNAKSKMKCRESNVIMLFDNTVFGSATDGALLTPNGLYAHNMFEDEKFIEWKKIHVVEGKSSALWINRKEFLQMNLLSEEARLCFINLVTQISQLHQQLK